MSYNAILVSSIMQKGLPATAGSKMLTNFISPIDATVVTRLEAAGVQIVGRCDVGEFGVEGLLGRHGDGSLVFFDDNNADLALCNDYTGAVSLAAAKQGLYYIHPTYGSVSRYGLIPAVSSMDQIGVLCKSPEVGFEVLRMISGFDGKDGVMVQRTKDKGQMANDKGQMTNDKEQIVEKYSEIFPQIMQILCCAEIGNNISRYDGIKFGYRAKGYNGLRELYTKSRTEAFGEDVKLAAVLGAMVLSQENYMRYYNKAMRLRRMIRDSFVSMTKGQSLWHTHEDLGFRIQDNKDLGFRIQDLGMQHETVNESMKSSYNLLILSRLCGLPSLSTPEGVYVADVGREEALEKVVS